MDREKFIKLARQVCDQAPREDWNSTAWVFGDDGLERFAALIERETRLQTEQDRIDAECFRFWVREAASNPVGMAQLISRCVTEQEYRDAIIPCVEKAKAAIAKATGGNDG